MDIIQVFNKIRDLPYHCPESLEDEDYRCWGKNRLLFEELSKGDFEVRFRVCDFLWSQQRIPKEITSKSPKDLDQHLYLEIKLDNQWIILDCSNDSKLPSYNNWDGKSDCEIAVKYIKIYSSEESKKLEKQEKIEFVKNFNKYKELYFLMNKFFDKLRLM
jgi:hypothetical protein